MKLNYVSKETNIGYGVVLLLYVVLAIITGQYKYAILGAGIVLVIYVLLQISIKELLTVKKVEDRIYVLRRESMTHYIQASDVMGVYDSSEKAHHAIDADKACRKKSHYAPCVYRIDFFSLNKTISYDFYNVSDEVRFGNE
jgi:hypothetical protein